MPTRKPPPKDDQLELFSAVFTDILSRETQDTMEAPFLSLSKKRRFQPINYIGPNDVEVTVSGGEPHGIANIWDFDLILWALSQIRHAADLGLPVSRKIRFSRRAYLKDVRRSAGGSEYARLDDAIARLKNTTITTSIRAQGRRRIMFSWIEFADIESDEAGKTRDATIVLPEWLFEAVCNHKLVLTLHRDYFLLTGGIERWLYRVIRKGAGSQPTGWKWKLRTLHERSGTRQQFKYFAREIRKIASKSPLLDYELKILNRAKEQYLQARRIQKSRKKVVVKVATPETASVYFLKLDSGVYEKAKQLIPGYDVYAIEQEWKKFNERKKHQIKNAEAAFLGFCRTYADKNPIPAR